MKNLVIRHASRSGGRHLAGSELADEMHSSQRAGYASQCEIVSHHAHTGLTPE